MGLTIAVAVLPAILLSGIPDRAADTVAAKTTLVVRLGAARTARLAQGLTLLSALLAMVLALVLAPVGLLLPLVVVPHAALQIWMLARYLRAGAPEGRIDLLLGARWPMWRGSWCFRSLHYARPHAAASRWPGPVSSEHPRL